MSPAKSPIAFASLIIAATTAIALAATVPAATARPAEPAGSSVMSASAPAGGVHTAVSGTAARSVLFPLAARSLRSGSAQPAEGIRAARHVNKRRVGGGRLASTGTVVSYPASAPRLPAVPASAYVIANASTGKVLAAKDAHGLFPPASTLKVLTAITMLPRLRPGATVLATKRAASVEPNIIGLIPGRRYKIADLFRALLLISANDAAVSLVQASGSLARGMTLVNAEARWLQAYDVVAKRPNGLPARGQVVSAYDLALIARQALSMPAFMRYDRTLASTFPIRPHHRVAMVNQNRLLTDYPGGLGGKIGWTVRAGATYIGMARRHGVTLIVTVLHATPLTEITSAEKLLDWGFAVNARIKPVGVLVPPLSPRP